MAKASSEPESLQVVPISYTFNTQIEAEPTLNAVLAAPPATVSDALDFVADIQDKQEKEFLASGQDPAPLKQMSGTEFEDYLLAQYNRDYYTIDTLLSS